MIRINSGYIPRPHGRTGRQRLGVALLAASTLVAPPALASAQGCPVNPPPLALPLPGAKSTLTADQASLQNDIAQAKGDVRLQRNGQALEAPFVRYNRKSSQAQAHGGVRYRRPGLYVHADNGDFNVNKQTGQFNDAHYSVTSSGGRGKAKKVVALGPGRYTLTDADYSTCAGPHKAWMLSARHLKINRKTGVGVAHHATMRFYGLPVLYTPYISFPIDKRRHTGVLTPTFGSSNRSGFELTVPYYINLAPNYDATLVPRILTARGLQLGGQFRYITAHQVGEFDGEYLPHDQKYGGDRSLVHFRHIGELNQHIGIEANYNRVSDRNYFNDISNNLTVHATSQLDRSARLTMADTGIRFSLLAQSFQLLYPSSQSGPLNNDPYQRLPQARLEMLSPTAPFQAGLDAEFTRFRRSHSIGADRVDLRPRLLWGVDHGGWYARSEAAYRYTRYNLHGADTGNGAMTLTPANDVINRGIPSFKLDSGLRFSRLMDNGWIQTLEPRMQYLYVGYENQSNIPIFDSGSPNLHFDRLFMDNRYTGIDRIGDANQVTLGMTSRVIEPKSGRTLLKLDFGRIVSFRNLKVTLPYSGTSGYQKRGSDYVVGAEFQPSAHLSARATVQYDAHDNRVDRAIATTRYTSRTGYQLDLGYRFYRNFRPSRYIIGGRDNYTVHFIPSEYETLEQTVVSFRAPITARLDVLARWNYSLAHSQNVETLAGLEYRPSCCWAGRVAVRHYVGNYNSGQNTAVLFQFVLNGLGQFGNTIRSFVQNNAFSNDTTVRSSRPF